MLRGEWSLTDSSKTRAEKRVVMSEHPHHRPMEWEPQPPKEEELESALKCME